MSQRAPRLTGRQLAIMHVLWRRGRATVAEVQADLESDTPLAYSTVATLLARLDRRGIVRHTVDGRTFIYEPAVTEDRIGTSLVSDLVRRAFDGSPSQLVSHLLDTEHIDPQELARIRQLLEQHETAPRHRSKRKGK